MAGEERRSNRTTKGQHKNKASSSPAPAPKPAKTAKSKPPKKSAEPTPTEDADDDEQIRCICGDENPNDKRAFVGCDDCSVWQHNICMGLPEEEEEVPDSYLCEQCGPEDHRETLQAMARGEKIWEVRNKIYQNEKKAGKNRKGKKGRQGWLKKDVPLEDGKASGQETGVKRKREERTAAAQSEVKDEDEDEQPPRQSSRQDKRRKPAAPVDPETEIVDIDKLPTDRQKIAMQLSKILAEEINVRAKAGAFRVPDGHTPKSLGDFYAVRIEYALKMNHGDTTTEEYRAQFRTLNANLKKNKVLIERLLKKTLTPDELSTMTSEDMASEELLKERAAMKEQLDRQAVAVEDPDAPRYRRTHKGDELIEDVNAAMGEAGGSAPQPVRERTNTDLEMGDADSPSRMDGAASPQNESHGASLSVKTRTESNTGMHERRTSSQQFDINNIWAKTGQSPTSAAPRPLQMPPRRRSSVPQQQPQDGTKEDADVDRMLQDDDDETYSPAEYSDPDAVVWRGKLVQTADSVAPTVSARFIAGRDISRDVSWENLLPAQITIDGRLSIDKAEEYLCSLQYATTSDVSVLAMTPNEDSAEAFETFFTYFRSRGRYAVVKNDKPALVKDLYIIPLEPGEAPPTHVGMMMYNALEKTPVKEKTLLATFVVGRAPAAAPAGVEADEAAQQAGQQTALPPAGANGGPQALPSHMRAATQGPSASPLNTNNPTFSPTNDNPLAQGQHQPISSAYGAGIPPNPYTPTPPTAAPGYNQQQVYQYQQYPPQQYQQQYPPQNSLINEVLGPLAACETAQRVVEADPNISRQQLEHLRQILEEDVVARNDIQRLAIKLQQP